MKNDNFVFFWGGPFSQWYKSSFTIDGTAYNCCEQYMMAQKAILFGDEEAYKEIMEEKDPKKQKAIGRMVKNFEVNKWNKVCRKIVYDANLAKFSDSDLKFVLLSTGNKEIVEASPFDRIWGIGLGAEDPRCLDKTQWQGTNWLGVALMEVRNTLREQ